PQFLDLTRLQKLARRTRELLGRLEPEQRLPKQAYDVFGRALETRVRNWSLQCRNIERQLGRIQEMLRLYRPFIHDYDYVFCTDRIRAASARLSGREYGLFGFDPDRIDWRCYWMDVLVPGFEKWSFPLMRGEQPPEDPAIVWEEDVPRAKRKHIKDGAVTTSS